MKKVLTIFILVAGVLSFGYCSSNQPKPKAPKAEEIDTAKKPTEPTRREIRPRDIK